LRSSTTIEPSLETSTPINTDNGVLRICAYGAMRQAKGLSKYCEEEGGFHCWLNQVAIQILHGTERMSAVSSYTIIPSFITQSSDEFVISAFYANQTEHLQRNVNTNGVYGRSVLHRQRNSTLLDHNNSRE
jgi:hypothetical protein